MELYFKTSKEKRLIASPIDEDDALNYIYKFCEERNFRIYYVRTWNENDYKIFDVGSHVEFFHLKV